MEENIDQTKETPRRFANTQLCGAMPDINNFRQNHPELVVQDILRYDRQTKGAMQASMIRFILKYRGINKWLRIRRLLIQLKVRWLQQINELEEEVRFWRECTKEKWHEINNHADVSMWDIRLFRKYQRWADRLAGERIGLIKARQQIRALCHSPRDIDWPETDEFPENCMLPEDFPEMPNKRWFWAKAQG